MEINIDNYLSDYDKEEIAKDVFRESLKDYLKTTNITTFIGNLSYKIAWEIIDDVLSDDKDNLRDLIHNKTIEVIKDLTSYSIFRNSDNFGNKASLGQEIMDETVLELKPMIQSRVKEVVNEDLDRFGVKFEIADALSDAIYNLFKMKEVE